MVNQELIEYLNRGITNGFSLIELKNKLLLEDWKINDIEKAMEYVTNTNKIYKKVPEKNYMKMLLLIVGSIILLLLIFIVLTARAENIKNTITPQKLEKGVLIELNLQTIKLNYKEGVIQKIKLIKATPSFSYLNIGGNEIRFGMKKNKNLDLDSDGVEDVEITYDSAKNGIPLFFIKSVTEK